MTEHDFETNWLMRKYGLSLSEAMILAEHPRVRRIEADLERWREANGRPAATSGLTRGKLLAIASNDYPNG